jgi:thymidylate synthase (FAD)
MLDPWKKLRSEVCFGNIEPTVTLVNNPDENIIAESASTSYGTNLKDEAHKRRLIVNLIKKGHHVPLEFCVFIFRLEGVSKSCSGQIARHRMSSQVSSSRRYRAQAAEFVYPLLSEEQDEVRAATLYGLMSTHNKSAMEVYKTLRNAGITKQDARRVIPVCSAVEKYISINARSLMNFFRLRLSSDAEWEIRRLALLILDIVYKETPSLFEDIYEKYLL